MRQRPATQAFGAIEILTLSVGDNYVYLVCSGSEAIVVDPTAAAPVLRALHEKALRLATILNTHGHSDHTGGNAELKEATGCEVIGPAGTRVPAQDRGVRGADTVPFASREIQVLATPGHGATDVCYYLPPGDGPGMVWTGDTLFIGGCGRLFGGDPAAMWASLSKLAALPGDTLVYCGHDYTLENYDFASGVDPGYEPFRKRQEEVRRLVKTGQPTVPSTIAEEKRSNVFLRSRTPEMKEVLGMPNASDIAVFAELRRRKDRF